MAAGALTEVVTEEIAQNLEEVAAVTRRIDARGVGFILIGLGIGAAAGFYFGHRWNREKIKAEVFEQAEKEIDAIRDLYQQKIMAAQQKPSLDEALEEAGYSQKKVEDLRERPLPAPVPVREPTGREPTEAEIVRDRDWNYPEEIQNRTHELPYVVHQSEFNDNDEGYNQVTYTYWAKDDVLTGSDNRPLPHADTIVGQDNLKWGHGADDDDVVFVRNELLELDMEICRIHKSYEEEVLGLERDESETN